MKTEDIYIAKLSMVVSRDHSIPLNAILVKKIGKYPFDLYKDMYTEDIYPPANNNLHLTDKFIDTLAGFNYVTGNDKEHLPKKKILKMFENVVGGK